MLHGDLASSDNPLIPKRPGLREAGDVLSRFKDERNELANNLLPEIIDQTNTDKTGGSPFEEELIKLGQEEIRGHSKLAVLKELAALLTRSESDRDGFCQVESFGNLGVTILRRLREHSAASEIDQDVPSVPVIGRYLKDWVANRRDQREFVKLLGEFEKEALINTTTETRIVCSGGVYYPTLPIGYPVYTPSITFTSSKVALTTKGQALIECTK